MGKSFEKKPSGWLKRHLNKNVISLKDNVIEDHDVERSLRSSERMVTEFSKYSTRRFKQSSKEE